MKKINKDQLNPEYMTKAIIKPMKYVGCRPGYRSWWEKIIAVYFILYSVIIVLLHGLNFLFDSNLSQGKKLEEANLLFGFVQVIAKFSMAITKGDVLMSMLNSLWNDVSLINKLDEKHKKIALTFYSIAKRFSDIFYYAVISSVLLYSLQAIIRGSLLHEISFPHKEILKNSPYYEIAFVIETVMMLLVTSGCFIPIDQLFIQLIMCVCVQFQILREEVKLLNRDDNVDKISVIKRIVDHHNKLIRFLEKFENVYSSMLLVILATTYINLTLTMYGVLYLESIQEKAAYICMYFSSIGQMFCYCVAGQLVQNQSVIVGEAAYEIEWYEIPDLQIRKDIINIIARSQRQIHLTAGGIMNLNMESFLKVVKTSFSLLTFLFNVRDV